jgi:transcriptional regulator NrdR family protein
MRSVGHIIDGVQCPRCNGESSVIDSRDGETSRRRRRKCNSCEHRYTTYEVHADDYERLQTFKLDTTQFDLVISLLSQIKSQFGDANGHRKGKD